MQCCVCRKHVLALSDCEDVCAAVQVKERGTEGDAFFGYQSILSAWRSPVSSECHVQQTCKQNGRRYSFIITSEMSMAVSDFESLIINLFIIRQLPALATGQH